MKGWDTVHVLLVFHILCNDLGVHFVGNNVFWIVHVSLVVNVVHDALDVLHPRFHFDIGHGRFQTIKHAVRGAFRVSAATHVALLLTARALLAIGPLRMTPVKHGNRIFHAFALGKILFGQFQFVGLVYEIHHLIVVSLHLLELRHCCSRSSVFLAHRFKLGGNLLLECKRVCINAGVDSAFHDSGWFGWFGCLFGCANVFKSIFKNIAKKQLKDGSHHFALLTFQVLHHLLLQK